MTVNFTPMYMVISHVSHKTIELVVAACNPIVPAATIFQGISG